MKTLILMMALAAQSVGGEFAVLATGFRLHADRHEFDGATVKLYQKDGGFTQLDASLVTGFETEVEVAAEVVAAPVAPATVAATKAPRELVEAAANLFSHLRELDGAGVDSIAVMPIPGEGLGEAINDRLRHAAAPRNRAVQTTRPQRAS